MDCGEIEVQSTEILFFIRDFQQPLINAAMIPPLNDGIIET
jgi:hypothetical protein